MVFFHRRLLLYVLLSRQTLTGVVLYPLLDECEALLSDGSAGGLGNWFWTGMKFSIPYKNHTPLQRNGMATIGKSSKTWMVVWNVLTPSEKVVRHERCRSILEHICHDSRVKINSCWVTSHNNCWHWTLRFWGAGESVVSIGHSHAFYVVSVPLEYILSIPPHSAYVIVYSYF